MSSDPQPDNTRNRTGIATVCLSGTLDDKLTAAAAAGFDGVEIFENDLIASPWSPEEIGRRCADLGLSVDLYQPFRDFDSVHPERFRANLRRARHKFELMRRLGADTVLVCSAVAGDAVTDDAQLADQLHQLAELAAEHGMRVAYEALAWGRHVSTFEHSWRIVREVDHRALGLCVDSFHILSRGGDPAGIREVPGEKLFFVQLADAPRLSLDVLEWSRHHRLFPGQGGFDMPGFVGHVLATGYRGPLSLEVFNDVFRQADPGPAAIDAMRSLRALDERLPDHTPQLPSAPELGGHAFAELAVDGTSGPALAEALTALGFRHTRGHRSKPVQLWEQGQARVLLNYGGQESGAVAALGVRSTNPTASAERAEALLSPVLPRTRRPDEADLAGVAAPDGTRVFFCRDSGDGAWLSDFSGPREQPGTDIAGITGIDHVALTQPFDQFEEAALFYRAVLGLEPEHTAEFAGPFGLVRSRAVTDADHQVRFTLDSAVLRRGEWAPAVRHPQHVAFATDDVFVHARAAHRAGAPVLSIPDNYYDDLDARFDLDPALTARLRELSVLYDRDEHGEYLHYCTEVVAGRVFFEVVERRGDYRGYGAANAPVRMAAHRNSRLATEQPG